MCTFDAHKPKVYSRNLILAAAAVLTPMRLLEAAPHTWNTGSGNWSTPGNWTPSGVPGGGDDANITLTDGVSRTITYDYSGSAVTLNSLTLDLTNASGTATSVLSISANNLTSSAEYIGNSGTASHGVGAINQSGGVNTVPASGIFYLGTNSTDTGTYTLGGTGSLVVSGEEDIGFNGNGIFNQSAGSNAAGIMFLSLNGGNSTYNLGGTGTLTSSADENIGYNGTGTVIQSGGTNNPTGNLDLATRTGSSGNYTLSAGSLTAGNEENIGDTGTGFFNQSGGTNIANGIGMVIGGNIGGTGTYTLSGTGSLSAVGGLAVGDVGGMGNFNQSGGTNTIGHLFDLGEVAASTGIYTLSGGSLSATDDEFIGFAGTGIFNQSGGTHSAANGVLLGVDAQSTGTYTLSATGTLSATTVDTVGYNGTGIFNQSGGSNLANAGLSVGSHSGSTGTYTLSGTGSLSVTGSELIGDSGTGTFNQSGGTNTITSGYLALGNSSGGAGSMTLGGGITTVSNLYVGGSNSGATGIGKLTLNNAGQLMVGSTLQIYSTGQLNINGGSVNAATLNLAGSYSQTAGTASFGQVSGGQLVINGGVTRITGPALTSQVSGLAMGLSGTLDIYNSSLAINYGANASPESAIKAALASGYNSGAWNGTGIISSVAATKSGKYAVGYVDGSLDQGTSVPAKQVLIDYTLVGDTNLDGAVNLTDLLALLNNYGKSSADWSQGDFNYDGTVNLTDLLSLLNNYGQTASRSTSDSVAAVPEPAMTGLILIATAIALTIRRRSFSPPAVR